MTLRMLVAAKRPPAGARRLWDSLAARLALTVGVGALAVCTAAGGLYLHLMEERLLAQVGSQVHTAVLRAADDLDQRVLLRRRALEAAAFDLTSSGRALAADDAQAYLAESSPLAALFDRLMIADAEGRPLAARPRTGAWRSIQVADRDYFQQARDSGRLVVSEPVFGKVSQAPIVTFTAPLTGASGAFGGVLIGAVVLEQGGLLDQMREATVGTSGRFFVVTRAGRYLLHPDRARLMQAVDVDAEPALAQALRGRTGWMHVPWPPPAAGVYAVKALNHAPWLVGARIDEQEALAPLRAARVSALLVGLSCVLSLTVLIALVTMRAVRPLQRLQRQVEEIEAGRHRGAVDVWGTAEIRRVAEAFNRLQDAQTRLQETVAAREAFHRSLSENSPLAVFVA
ncbi:MAG: cache domain-containing protein, partial [Burkholderiaceae bacterium]|nr:cache domain-containing protein [Burkholderiaceae bacterium]